MLWVQVGVCLLIWIGCGWWLARPDSWMHRRLDRWSRKARTLLGSVGLLFGLAVLITGVYAVATGEGMADGRLKPWAWIAVAVLGLLFVGLQVLGAGAMLSLVTQWETADGSQTSKPQEKDPE